MKRTAALVLPLLCLAPGAWGDLADLSLPELIERADLVVVGKARVTAQKAVLLVTETLKGRAERELVLGGTVVDFDVIIRDKFEGLFFLRAHGGRKWWPFHYRSFMPAGRRQDVLEVLALMRDPAPFTDLARYPENADIVYVLGQAFAAYRVESPDVPSLGEAMKGIGPSYHLRSLGYAVPPWRAKGVVTLRCRYDPAARIRITVESARPPGELAEYFRERLLAAARSPGVAEKLKARFRATLDTRWPERVGSLKAEAAAAYLRERLESENPEVVKAALLALAKMSDLDAVPAVIRLTRHKEPAVKSGALRFLGWAGDARAIPELCRILDAAAYPRDHAIADPAAWALSRCRGPEVVPCLERAAARNVSRACGALGAIGRKGSFEVLLKAAERYLRESNSDNPMYWLVRRSNKPLADWMDTASLNGHGAAARVPKWRAWWEKNGKDFAIVRTQKEAIRMGVDGAKHRRRRDGGEAAVPGWQSVVYAYRDEKTRMCSLKANGSLLQRSGKARELRLRSLWRYHPDKKGWKKVDLHVGGPIPLRPVRREIHSCATDQAIANLTDRIGLYWAEWQEDGHRASTLVFSGPIPCNDLRIGRPPAGFIPACVPYPDSGRATFVPDPKLHCRE